MVGTNNVVFALRESLLVSILCYTRLFKLYCEGMPTMSYVILSPTMRLKHELSIYYVTTQHTHTFWIQICLL
jgi:hypothetical protein